MVRPARTHPTATAHQPKASRAKNSLLHWFIYFVSVYAFSLFLVSHFCFLTLISLYESCKHLKQIFHVAQTI